SEVVKASFDRGYPEHDFCGDAYAYKMRWTSEVRLVEDVLVFSRRLRPALAGLVERRLVPKLKELRERWRARTADGGAPGDATNGAGAGEDAGTRAHGGAGGSAGQADG